MAVTRSQTRADRAAAQYQQQPDQASRIQTRSMTAAASRRPGTTKAAAAKNAVSKKSAAKAVPRRRTTATAAINAATTAAATNATKVSKAKTTKTTKAKTTPKTPTKRRHEEDPDEPRKRTRKDTAVEPTLAPVIVLNPVVPIAPTENDDVLALDPISRIAPVATTTTADIALEPADRTRNADVEVFEHPLCDMAKAAGIPPVKPLASLLRSSFDPRKACDANDHGRILALHAAAVHLEEQDPSLERLPADFGEVETKVLRGLCNRDLNDAVDRRTRGFGPEHECELGECLAYIASLGILFKIELLCIDVALTVFKNAYNCRPGPTFFDAVLILHAVCVVMGDGIYDEHATMEHVHHMPPIVFISHAIDAEDMPIYYAQQLAAQVKPFLGAHTGHVQKSLCQKQLQLLLDGRFSQNMTTGIRKLQAQVVRWSINSEDATPEKFQEHIIKCGVASQLYIAAAHLYLRHGRAVVLQAAIELVFHPECRKHRERGSAHCRLSGCHIDSLSGLEFDQHDVMKARAHLKKFVQHNDIFRFSRETNDQTAMADFYKNGFQFK